MDEACWGLRWLLKTSFGDGYRCGSINSRRSDNIMGNDDDVTSRAHNSPLDNFNCSAAEAIAARVLKTRDPELADQALKMAAADWQFAADSMNNKRPEGLWTGTFDSDNIEYEIPAEGILAAVDLWITTGNKQYEEKATAWAQLIVNSQQRKKPDWDKPMTGFFYTGTTKDRLLHFVHRGRDQIHILALTKLCETFPDHPDWMKWYSAVTLYSEYLKAAAKYTAPYNVMPASIYNDSEYLHVPESRRESFRKQVLNGIPLGKGNYLRIFPVWMDYRGHFGTILPQAQSLSGAALLRGDLESNNWLHISPNGSSGKIHFLRAPCMEKAMTLLPSTHLLQEIWLAHCLWGFKPGTKKIFLTGRYRVCGLTRKSGYIRLHAGSG